MDEALEAKASVDELLETFHEKSEERDNNLKTIEAKLEQLSKAEIKANEYKDVLDQQQAELDQLKQKMQLKVSWSQKQSSKFSFEPKIELKYFCNSALASKMGQTIKIMAHYHAN